ncbi:lecithin retinol acyltransferase-like [Lethenteron reissneri]|uniref:lecithin retinol acyltransferase-like n=1 Tax=Lethenteron reissneri TaxID=7753 RepID=UPI002AB71685|nr:lecithin retinol acyltransferase-like [Lethenteron reissneri]
MQRSSVVQGGASRNYEGAESPGGDSHSTRGAASRPRQVSSRNVIPRENATAVAERSHCAHRRGDLLQVPRTLFTHVGIYLGEQRVAHFLPDVLPLLTSDARRVRSVVTNTRLVLGSMARNGTVRIDAYDDFVYGAPTVLVNATDCAETRAGNGGRSGGGGDRVVLEKERSRPLPAEEVASRAENFRGDCVYSLLWNNCEHFATHCRYGPAWSDQTEQFCAFIKACIRDKRSVLCGVSLGVLLCLYCGASLPLALTTFLFNILLWMAG